MLNVSFFGFPFVYAGFLRFLLDFLNVSFAPIHPYIRGKNPLCKLKIQLTFSPGKPQRWSEQTTPFSRSKPPGHCPAGSAGIKEGEKYRYREALCSDITVLSGKWLLHKNLGGLTVATDDVDATLHLCTTLAVKSVVGGSGGGTLLQGGNAN